MATIIDELISRLGFDITGKENLREFKSGMSAAEKQAKGFSSSITQFARNATAGMAAIGAAVAGVTASMFAMANSAAGPLDDLVKAADRAGVSVEALQELGFVAEQSGSSVTEMSNAVEMMSRRLAEAARGQGRAKTALEAYGLSATDAAGNVKNATDFMSELADTFQGLSEAERLDLGQQLGLSRGLITMLAQGNDEIERLRQVARDAGLIFTDEDARNAEAYNDAMNLLMRSVRAMRDRIAIDLLPTLMRMIGGMQDWLNANRAVIQQNVGAFMERMARHARTMSDGFQWFADNGGTAFYLALGAIAAAARPFIARMVAIGFALDEILSWWNGDGETFLGKFSEALQNLGIPEGVADGIIAFASAVALFALISPRRFGQLVSLLWRFSGAAAVLKLLGASAMFTSLGAAITTFGAAALAASFKLWPFVAAALAVAGAVALLRRVDFKAPSAEFNEGTPSLQDRGRAEERRIEEADPDFMRDSLGNRIMQRLFGGGGADAPATVQPQSFGTQPGESFSPAIGGGVTDNRNQSTNVDVGGINVSVGGGADGRSIASEITDALNRRINIHGASPATP